MRDGYRGAPSKRSDGMPRRESGIRDSMDETHSSRRRGRPSWRVAVASIISILAWLAFSFRSANLDDADSGADQVGRLLGSSILPLVLAPLARLPVVKVLWRLESLPFWSPWIFAMAAVFALLAFVRTAPDRARDDRAADIAACVRGGIEQYNDLSSAAGRLARPGA